MLPIIYTVNTRLARLDVGYDLFCLKTLQLFYLPNFVFGKMDLFICKSFRIFSIASQKNMIKDKVRECLFIQLEHLIYYTLVTLHY